jgi:hypothetical protein|tara:strand:+ start:258 stop:512 length:255 start_codon:yes stop_codon:yes gene_type:complete
MAEQHEDSDQHGWLADFVRLIVLAWALVCLSMSYLGQFKAMDPTFSASLLTAVLSQYGVAVGKNGNKKKEEPKLGSTTTTSTTK